MSSSQGSAQHFCGEFSRRKRAGSPRLKSFIFYDLKCGKSATKLSLFCELFVCVKLSMAETLDGYGLQIRPHPRCRINSDGSSGGGPHSLAVKIKCVGAIDDSGNRWQPICRPFSLHRLLINLLLFIKKFRGECCHGCQSRPLARWARTERRANLPCAARFGATGLWACNAAAVVRLPSSHIKRARVTAILSKEQLAER